MESFDPSVFDEIKADYSNRRNITKTFEKITEVITQLENLDMTQEKNLLWLLQAYICKAKQYQIIWQPVRADFWV